MAQVHFCYARLRRLLNLALRTVQPLEPPVAAVLYVHRANGWTPERLAVWLRDRGFKVQHTSGSWNGLLWAERFVALAEGTAVEP